MAGRRSRGLRVLAATAVLAAALVRWAPPASADRVRDMQWHLQYLNIARAHELSQGEGITIAVIDTGVDADHPDLAGNILPGLDAWAEIHGEDPGDGWGDPDGHGTGMAGLIAAHGHGRGSASGALGIAPLAKIIPIRLPVELELAGPEIHDAMTVAIKEALKRGADIVSLSVTGPRGDQIKPILEAGKIAVVAGGNAPDAEYPTATPGSVAVGAVRSDGQVADVSVRGRYAPPPLDELALGRTAGAGYIWLTAPGEEIVSSYTRGGYATGTGTSASTAIVSGAAALVWSRYPELTGEQVVRHLPQTTTDKGAPGPDVEYGYGDLDLVRALETVPAPPVTTTTTTACDPCTPSTGASGEAAAARPSAHGGSRSARTGPVVTIAAIVAAGSLALARVRGRRHRPARAGPDPGPAPSPWAVPSPGPLPLPPPPPPPPGHWQTGPSPYGRGARARGQPTLGAEHVEEGGGGPRRGGW